MLGDHIPRWRRQLSLAQHLIEGAADSQSHNTINGFTYSRFFRVRSDRHSRQTVRCICGNVIPLSKGFFVDALSNSPFEIFESVHCINRFASPLCAIEKFKPFTGSQFHQAVYERDLELYESAIAYRQAPDIQMNTQSSVEEFAVDDASSQYYSADDGNDSFICVSGEACDYDMLSDLNEDIRIKRVVL